MSTAKTTTPDPTVVRQTRIGDLRNNAGQVATDEHANSPHRTTTVTASLNVSSAGDGKSTKDTAAVTVTIATTHEEATDPATNGGKKKGDKGDATS